MNFQGFFVLFYTFHVFVYEKTHSFHLKLFLSCDYKEGTAEVRFTQKIHDSTAQTVSIHNKHSHYSPSSLTDAITVCSISITDLRSETNILEKKSNI